jgi:hypothetical protein
MTCPDDVADEDEELAGRYARIDSGDPLITEPDRLEYQEGADGEEED